MKKLKNLLDFNCSSINLSKLIQVILRWGIQKFEIYYEKILGLDFILVIHPRDLGLDENFVVRGTPSGNIYLTNILQDLNITDADSILDVGCSKGSAIRRMLAFPFQRVDGLEISEKLAVIAKENFIKLKKENVSIYNVDARCFKHYGNYNFFYFYNPFPCFVMSDVIQEISKQVGNAKITIIYNNPACHSVLVNNGFEKFGQYPDEWGNGIYVYSN